MLIRNAISSFVSGIISDRGSDVKLREVFELLEKISL